MRQVLLDSKQALLAVLQGLRNLNTATTKEIPIKASTQVQKAGHRYPQKNIEAARSKRDLSEISCFNCRGTMRAHAQTKAVLHHLLVGLGMTVK